METSQAVARIVDDVVHIGTIPSTLAEIRRIARDPEHDTAALVAVMERDPPIAAQCLHLANSPLYGLRHRTSSLAMVCMVLGVRGVENLVLQAVVMDLFLSSSGTDHLCPRDLWESSQRTALAARLLASAAPRIGDADEAYTCGLLRDLGKILLLQERPAELDHCAAEAMRRGISLDRAIEEVFGFGDWMVLQRLADRWRLGDAVHASARPAPDPRDAPHRRAWWALIEAARRIAAAVAAHTEPELGSLEESLALDQGVIEWVRDEVETASTIMERRRCELLQAEE